jgi:tRNA(Ile)-lysidine synthase
MGPAPAVAAVRLAVRRCLADLEPGDVVLAAVSGGADSMALAAALATEAEAAGVRPGAVTVDHGLQDGSAERAARVAEVLVRLGLDPVDVRSVTVGTDGGPEAAARAARYAALDAAAEEHAAPVVLLGHTRDDQAETVLLGLARGSGARSLAGMAPASGRYRRPLLGLDRETVRQAVDGLPTWEDPHNADPSFARARVRTDALPALESALGPGVAAALARTAGLLRSDADALDAWADRAAAEAADGDDGFAVDALASLPTAVRTRVLRRAVIAAGAPPSDLTADHVVAVDALVTSWHGQGPLQLPGGVGARRACGRLLLARDAGAGGR